MCLIVKSQLIAEISSTVLNREGGLPCLVLSEASRTVLSFYTFGKIMKVCWILSPVVSTFNDMIM